MPTVMTQHTRIPVQERFWKYVQKGDRPGDCWQWVGARSRGGYGQISDFRDGKWKRIYAHRLVLEMMRDCPTSGMDVDHLCRNPGCCNPDHLEIVTHQENMKRGISGKLAQDRARLITQCPQGHAYDAANTYYRPSGARRCRECELDYHRRKKGSVHERENSKSVA